MNIDKKKIKMGIWCEDANSNCVEYDKERYDFPREAETVHIQWPLVIYEEVFRLEDHDGRWTFDGTDRLVTFETSIGRGNEKVILAMANSGDYTLGEAIIVYASACERCKNALAYKYLNGEDGYPEDSVEYGICPTECDFCK